MRRSKIALVSLATVALAFALLTATPRTAHAKVHGSVALGSLLEATEPVIGGWAGADIWPGGKWGGRVDFFWLDYTTWLTELSLVRQLGATRPHLVMAAHFGAGYAESGAVTLAAGMTTQLGLRLGPLALISDLAFHASIHDGDFDPLITGVLGLAAAF